MRGPNEDTLRARVIRYNDESEEEWNERRKGLAVKEAAEEWLTTGGPIPKLKDLAVSEGINLENTVFGRVLDKFQTHYELFLKGAAEAIQVETAGWRQVAPGPHTLPANVEESMSLAQVEETLSAGWAEEANFHIKGKAIPFGTGGPAGQLNKVDGVAYCAAIDRL